MICRWQTFCRPARWFRLFLSREERKTRVWQLYGQMFITKNVQGYKKKEAFNLHWWNRKIDSFRLFTSCCSPTDSNVKGQLFLSLPNVREKKRTAAHNMEKNLNNNSHISIVNSDEKRSKKKSTSCFFFFVMSTHQQTVVIDVLNSVLFFVEDRFCSIKKEERHKLSTHK